MNNMRIIGIDYGEARAGIAITDALKITAQGLETINHNGSDKKLLARLDEIIEEYKDIETIVVGMPIHMNGDISQRAEITKKFIHKLKCKYNKMKITSVDERLTTVQAHRTMNDLQIDNRKKRRFSRYNISCIYIRNIY